MNNKGILRGEYSTELIISGKRGKYVKNYRRGTNIVVIDPELHKIFPDSESVNQALRKYANEHHIALA